MKLELGAGLHWSRFVPNVRPELRLSREVAGRLPARPWPSGRRLTLQRLIAPALIHAGRGR